MFDRRGKIIFEILSTCETKQKSGQREEVGSSASKEFKTEGVATAFLGSTRRLSLEKENHHNRVLCSVTGH